MAYQTGNIKYRGSFKSIRQWRVKKDKKTYAGEKGGANRDLILNSPAFARTRENMNEFAGCATVGKSIRTGQAQLTKQMCDSQFTGRLTGIVKKINLEDQSEARGYRAILISSVPQYLIGLNFNRNKSFEGSFSAPVETTVSAKRDSVILNIEPFNPLTQVNAPAGSTHFRFVNSISVISDYAYNSTTGIYEPIEPALNELSKVTYSDYI